MSSPLLHKSAVLHPIVEVPTFTQAPPLHVVPVAHPQSEQHETVVSLPLQM
jgi:hypothetical protein